MICIYANTYTLTYLFDSLFVLNEQLHTGDIYVQSGSLRWAFHRSVKTSIVLTAPGTKQPQTDTHKDRGKKCIATATSLNANYIKELILSLMFEF